MIKVRPHVLISLLTLLVFHNVYGDVKGRVRASVDAEGNPWVGQQVNVNLDILTTGYRFSDIQFNLPSVEGAFLLQTDSTTIKMSETSSGETWQIIRYPLALYPQKAGIINIPPIKVRFDTASSFGEELRNFDLQSQTLTLQALMPPGANPSEPVVSTSDFELTYTWSPETPTDEPGLAKTGDAVTLSVTRRAQGISGMLLNPLPSFTSDGLRVYPDAPLVNDKVDRGSLMGERTDSVTWMLERAGLYEWPEIRFQWWDPQTQQLKEKVVPGLTLEVETLPVANDSGTSGSEKFSPFDWRKALFIAATLALIFYFAWPLQKAFHQWLKSRQASDRQLQKSAYRKLLNTCTSGSPADIYTALSDWLQVLGHERSGLSAFAKEIGNPEFTEEVLQLQNSMVNPDSAAPWTPEKLLNNLPAIRQKLGQRNASASKASLPDLNPQTRKNMV